MLSITSCLTAFDQACVPIDSLASVPEWRGKSALSPSSRPTVRTVLPLGSNVFSTCMTVAVGLVSDTHGVFDPQLTGLLQGVAMILHAGDVGHHGMHAGELELTHHCVVQAQLARPLGNLLTSRRHTCQASVETLQKCWLNYRR